MNSITPKFNRLLDGKAECELSFDGLGSDIEDSSTSSTSSDRDPRNYWLGMKYLDYLVAETVMSRAVKRISTESLEVLSHEHMQRFPYALCLEDLTKGEATDTASPYRDLIHVIGERRRRGTEEDRSAIISAVQRHLLAPSPAELERDLRRATPRRFATNAITSHDSGPTGPSPTQDLFRYSMALKEHCDQQGEMMKYTEKFLRAYPPSFMVTVHIQGLSFDGTGSSKKMARHHACWGACAALSIEP
ncbi:hypothetical protein LTR86_011003 [Recurvomyces mirabilis]|nr:hypothetical protein LTR86_011003 [Recurvomyces mirabilis]